MVNESAFASPQRLQCLARAAQRKQDQLPLAAWKLAKRLP